MFKDIFKTISDILTTNIAGNPDGSYDGSSSGSYGCSCRTREYGFDSYKLIRCSQCKLEEIRRNARRK